LSEIEGSRGLEVWGDREPARSVGLNDPAMSQADIDLMRSLYAVFCRLAEGGAGSGVQVNQRFFHICDLRDGKVLRVREYVERDQALEAAGLLD
jgi:hypothetical protein